MSVNRSTAVVTGATRGIGRGLAIGLGEQGFHVIITGRTKSGAESLESTKAAVEEAGGTCDFYVVDHSDGNEISQWFDTLSQSLSHNKQTLDLFVNNAFAAVSFIIESSRTPYWLKQVSDDNDDPGEVWDLVNGVGLRNNWICCVLATRIMQAQTSGAIVNITSWGGLVSLFDAAYSIGKAGIDRMSAELAKGAPKGIRIFALCPGFVGTEALMDLATQSKNRRSNALPLWNMETPIFIGRVLAAAVKREKFLREVHGKVVVAAEAADRLGVVDEKGFRALSCRSLQFSLLKAVPSLVGSPLRHVFPRWMVVPWPIVRYTLGALRFWN